MFSRKGLFVFSVMCLCIIVSAYSRRIDGSASYKSFNDHYTWLQTPPEGADSTMMICVRYSMVPELVSTNEKLPDFKIEMLEIPVVSFNDSLYLRLASLRSCGLDYDYRSFIESKVWIKAIKEGNRIRFINDEKVGLVDYDIHITAVRPPTIPGDTLPYEIYVDTIVHQWDTIYQKSLIIGESTDVIPSSHSAYYRWWDFDLLYSDLEAEYDENTGLIRNPGSSLLIVGEPQDFYRVPNPYFPGAEQTSGITIETRNFRDMMPIKDFIITPGIAITDPVSLPVPEVSYLKKSESHHEHGGHLWTTQWLDCNIYMDMINEDGEILDPSRLKVMVYIDDEVIGPLNGEDYLNPFKRNRYYKRFDVSEWPEDVQVMVYYEKDDGSHIESPKVRAVDLANVNEIKDDTNPILNFTADEHIYDLTGRIVNPENLSPGIYIQRGRKFILR